MATLRAQEEKADGTNRVIVSKQDMRITVLCPQGDTLAVFPIACGRNYGDKQQEWDFRTPEGHFVIESVEDTSLWPLDEARNSRRDIRPPLLPLESTRLHGHRHTRDRQPPSDTRTDNDGLHTPQQ